jgi:hypothetical protein
MVVVGGTRGQDAGIDGPNLRRNQAELVDLPLEVPLLLLVPAQCPWRLWSEGLWLPAGLGWLGVHVRASHASPRAKDSER